LDTFFVSVIDIEESLQNSKMEKNFENRAIFSFRSEDNDCRFLAMAELFLVNYARKKQEERWQNDKFRLNNR